MRAWDSTVRIVDRVAVHQAAPATAATRVKRVQLMDRHRILNQDLITVFALSARAMVAFSRGLVSIARASRHDSEMSLAERARFREGTG